MPIDKDAQYSIYDAGIRDGKAMAKQWLGEDPDLFELAIERFPSKTRKRLAKSNDTNMEAAARNYRDGLEDGVKAHLARELDSYIRWLREES